MQHQESHIVTVNQEPMAKNTLVLIIPDSSLRIEIDPIESCPYSFLSESYSRAFFLTKWAVSLRMGAEKAHMDQFISSTSSPALASKKSFATTLQLSDLNNQYEAAINAFQIPQKEVYNFSNIQGVLQEIHVLSKASSSTRASRILGIITPFISFIDRYALAIDTFCQFNPAPSALIWGSLRVLLQVGPQLSLFAFPDFC